MKKEFFYTLINPIIPFPKDDWKITTQYSFFRLISFYQLEVKMKEDLEHFFILKAITNETEETIYKSLIEGENIHDEAKIILVDDCYGGYEVEPKNLKDFFFEEIYNRGFYDYFFVLPKAKVILILNHDTKIFRCDFSKMNTSKKYWCQHRVIRMNNLSRQEIRKQLGNDYRYELHLKEQPVSEYKIRQLSKELEQFGLTISDLEKEDYPTEKHLLTKKQVNEASSILEKYLLEVYYHDKQKDKDYLRRVR